MIKENVSLSGLTTFRIGGKARYFSTAKTKEELKGAIIFAKENDLPFFILGGGSNILVPDEGLDGLVIKVETKGINFKKGEGDVFKVEVSAGENWDKFVKLAVEKGFYGLENLSGIPGTVGAAPIQNIGAYGVEIKNVLSHVEVIDAKTLKEKKLKPKDCEFGYRESIFKKKKGEGLIVTSVVFNLKKKGKLRIDYKDVKNFISENNIKNLNPRKIREIVLKIRKNKFPDLKKLGTAGSFFKNPIISKRQFLELKKKYPGLSGFPSSNRGKTPYYKVSLAWILDNVCDLKGFKENKIGLYHKQPLVLVNYGKGTAREIKKFSQKVSNEVFKKTGIKISNEVTFV